MILVEHHYPFDVILRVYSYHSIGYLEFKEGLLNGEELRFEKENLSHGSLVWSSCEDINYYDLLALKRSKSSSRI